MKRIFLDCKSLNHLDITKLTTDNVANMTGLFCGYKNLKELIYQILKQIMSLI